jgi:hypothetical protein
MSMEQKFWSFSEAFSKVKMDTDTDEDDPDETFITLEEFIGYFNEAIKEAESDIHKIDEDYFLTRDFVLTVPGVSEYDMPENIFADKIRGVRFNDGTTKYAVKRIKRAQMFSKIAALEDPMNASADYWHYIRNDTPGQRKFVILPPSREISVIPPMSPVAAFIQRWFIRNANSIPLPGQYTNPETLLPTAFDVATGAITVAPTFPYQTGDLVRFSLKSSTFTMPGGLSAGVDYYVVRLSDTRIKLAGSLAQARAAARGFITGDRIQEQPAGVIDGTTGSDGNTNFTLSTAPYSSASVEVYVNGIFLRQGTHYTILGQTLTFLAPFIPVVGQEIDVTYFPVSTEPTTNPTEVQEALTGLVDGANTIFTITQLPASPAALRVYADGILLVQGTHYEVANKTITFYVAPAVGVLLDAVYDTSVFYFSTTGTGFFVMKVKATRQIIDATVIDIPEFADFIIEWVKARVQFKDADPRLSASVQVVEEKSRKMVETLEDREPDDDNTIEPDLSFYEEMN